MLISLRQIEDLGKALRFLIPQERLASAETVFIKPNLGYSAPYPMTTSLESLRETIGYLKAMKSNLNIKVGEGSTSRTSSHENAKSLGVIALLQGENIQFIDLEQDDFEVVDGIGVPNTLINADLRISLPCIKIFRQSELVLSCAIKNYLGIPPRALHSEEIAHRRDSFHKDINNSVAEVYRVIQKVAPFEIHIADGTRILMGQENTGREKKWGRILVGSNADEIDMALCEKFGLDLPPYLLFLRNFPPMPLDA
jgi:uncharacterized protein (DUF362 family)